MAPKDSTLADMVGSIVAAFGKAGSLAERIKGQKADSNEEAVQDLVKSLSLGPVIVQGYFDADSKRLGEGYATGDVESREQLRNVLLNLKALTSALQGVLLDDDAVEFEELQEISDNCRVDAGVCLGQLAQRLTNPQNDGNRFSGISRSSHRDSSRLHYSHSQSTQGSDRTRDLRTPTRIPNYVSAPFNQQLMTPPEDEYPHDVRPEAIRRTTTESLESAYTNRAQHETRSHPRGDGESMRRPSSGTLGADMRPIFSTFKAQVPRQAQDSDRGSHLSLESGRGSYGREFHSNDPVSDLYRQENGFNPYSELGMGSSSHQTAQYGMRQSEMSYAHRAPPRQDSILRPSAGDRPRDLTGQWRPPPRETDHTQHLYPQHRYHDGDHHSDQRFHNSNYQGNSPHETRPFVAQKTPQFDPRHNQSPRNLQSMSSTDQESDRHSMFSYQPTEHSLHPSMRGTGVTSPTSTSEKPSEQEVGGFAKQFQDTFNQLRLEDQQGLDSPSKFQQSRRLSHSDYPEVVAPRQLSPPQNLESSNNATSLASSENVAGSMVPPSLYTANNIARTASSVVHNIPLHLPIESSPQPFCRSAVRLFLTPTSTQNFARSVSKSFETVNRPLGVTGGTIQHWRCTKCMFEGPIHILAPAVTLDKKGRPVKAKKGEIVFDPTVRLSRTSIQTTAQVSVQGGIKYRWAFLAKCHIPLKSVPDGRRDGSSGGFACLFCAVEGASRGWFNNSNLLEHNVNTSVGSNIGNSQTTPVFGQVTTFMDHLQKHRYESAWPCAEMQGRMRCIVGRVAAAEEEWEINLTPVEYANSLQPA